MSRLPAELNLLVIGGGPAGASTGIAAARLGLRVAIVEKETFPRYRLGETLPPKVVPLLSFLGVLEEVERAGFIRMAGTANLLGDALDVQLFDPGGETMGFQAERDRLDGLLLSAAERSGCVVVQAHEVLGLIVERGVVRGARLRDDRGNTLEVHAAYVADASGTPALIARELGLRRHPKIRTIAITGYWRDVLPPAEFPPEFTLLESLPDGWIWSLLLSDGQRNVTIASRAESGESAADRYQRMLAASRVLGPMLAGARLQGVPRACDASGSWSSRAAGPGFVLVGDAAYRVDPLTSQGVYKGIASGVLAAAVVNTALRRPDDAQGALAFYDQAEARTRRQYAASTHAIYARSPHANQPFWRERLGPLEEMGAVARSLDRARMEQERFLELLKGSSPEAIRVARAEGVRLGREPRLDGGFLEWRDTLVSHDVLAPVCHHPVDMAVLSPLLDGRTLREIFDEYAAGTSTPRTPQVGRLLVNTISSLIQDGLVILRCD